MVGNAPGAAPGYGQFPNNRFSPTRYSNQLIIANRILSVADAITNTKYEGDIKDAGDTVEILKEPTIVVNTHSRGQQVPIQFLNDEYLQLKIDQAYNFGFTVDDIEKRMSQVDWLSAGSDNGSYQLRNIKDANILAAMLAGATSVTTAGSSLGASGSPISVGFTSGALSPLDVLNRVGRLMDENNVPDDGNRFFVVAPRFFEALKAEDSSLINAQVTGDKMSILKNSKYGLGTDNKIHGMSLYKSNNTPLSADGNATFIAGHTDATATATAITKVKTGDMGAGYFGQYCQGLLVFGRKVIKPENLFRGFIQYV